jgi:PAS domain S-box-containing protein
VEHNHLTDKGNHPFSGFEKRSKPYGGEPSNSKYREECDDRTMEPYSASTPETSRNGRHRATLVVAMAAPGFLVAALTFADLLGPAEPLVARVVAGVAIVGLSIPQIGGSYWLWQSRFDTRDLLRVATWMTLGIVPITLLGAVTIAYQNAHGVALAEPLLVLSWVAGIGATGGFLTGVYDVRREHNGRKLDDVSSRFETLAATAPVAIVSLDTEGTVTAWGGAATELFGYERAEVLGEAYPLIPENRTSELDEHFDRLERGGRLQGVETKRRCKDGSLLDVSVWASPLSDGDGELTGAMVVLADISDRKQREQRLAVLRRVLRHNLGNRASVITGNAETLAAELDDDALLERVETIRESALELGDLGGKTREAERAIRADENRVHLATMFDRERRVFERSYPAAEVTFGFDCDEDDPALTYPPAVQSALHEVVVNAIEHSDRARPSVRVRVERRDGRIHLAVGDDGPGLPGHEREVLERERETPLRHSAGVGLWLVNWLVTSVGGTVVVSDNDPRGTVVTFELPAGMERAGLSNREAAHASVAVEGD